MKRYSILFVVMAALLLAAPVMAQQKKKAKALKVSGSVGLLDTEKNYMIIVTKEGKLITAEFNNKTKFTKLVPSRVKMSDINLGQAATVSYVKHGDKNVAVAVDYTAKAKKGK
jgi:hypothetical protein